MIYFSVALLVVAVALAVLHLTERRSEKCRLPTSIIIAIVALAGVELLRHRYTEAEPLMIAALPALEAQFGAGSPALAQPLSGLARIALAPGDMPAAEPVQWTKCRLSSTYGKNIRISQVHTSSYWTKKSVWQC